MSRKVSLPFKFVRFQKVLVEELQVLKEHLKQAHLQHQALKLAREEAVTKPIVVTIQLVWSKNARIRQ